MSTTRESNEPANSRRGLVWIGRYGELVRYVTRMGRMPREVAKPLDGSEKTEKQLGGWVRYQRRRVERGLLPGWQFQLLDAMPEFSWDPFGDQWDEWFEKLRSFLEREPRVPRYRTDDPDEKALAAWVHKQRHFHRQGTLAPDRAAALRELPFRIV